MTITIASPSPLPGRIQGLAALGSNLWWSWQPAARDLFRRIDGNLWERTRHNPLELLQRVDQLRLNQLAQDDDFLARYHEVMQQFEHLSQHDESWFWRQFPAVAGRTVAYFCAEFALHNSIPVYSGGLGVLAGDHCKAASDLGVPLVGVGLFYVKGYFDQKLRADGWQEHSDDEVLRGITPLTPVLSPEGETTLLTLKSASREIRVGAWLLKVGRVKLYLLDTNLDRNDPDDRELTHKLYGGDHDLRLKQEWILGVGGVRLLRRLGIEPTAWHANEGHAAFMFLERVRELTTGGVAFAEAVRQVRAASVFTTHTPVAAGHDTFAFDAVQELTGPMWDEMGISRETLMGLGRHPDTAPDRFHMTVLALRLAGRVNGVAARHGVESRRIWRSLWGDRDESRIPIGHITNGVHVGTWMAQPLRALLGEFLGADWEMRLDEPGLWDRVADVDDVALWRVHGRLRQALHSYLREDARHRWRDAWQDPAKLAVAGTLLSPTAFTIGFARRFATYKRADLLLHDADRLRRLVVDSRRPVQLVFAGKAHPADDPGKGVLQRVYRMAQDPQLMGRLAFIEDYEMHLAHRLVQGVDLWLNLPRVPMEACGTSGMKAALNGVPQLSTRDGWWAEGYTGANGWAIPQADHGTEVDEADAEHAFALLENEIVPRFYDRDERGIPGNWVQTMKQAIITAGQRFTARRMVQDYVREAYVPSLNQELPDDDPPAR